MIITIMILFVSIIIIKKFTHYKLKTTILLGTGFAMLYFLCIAIPIANRLVTENEVERDEPYKIVWDESSHTYKCYTKKLDRKHAWSREAWYPVKKENVISDSDLKTPIIVITEKILTYKWHQWFYTFQPKLDNTLYLILSENDRILTKENDRILTKELLIEELKK